MTKPVYIKASRGLYSVLFRRSLLVFILIQEPVRIHAQSHAPLFETRAVWFATVLKDGDWPPEEDGADPVEALRDRIREAHALGLNTFIFQVIARGDAMHRSSRLPWSPNLKGPGEDPGYDPLAVAVEEAHALGMELHAWINVFRVGDGNTAGYFAGVTNPGHVIFEHPDWVVQDGSDYWLDPSNADARAWMVENVMEVVRGYDIDAVHFDYIRYPQGGLEGDGDKFQANPGQASDLDAWRRDNVTRFVEDAYAAIVAEKPWVKVGSAPIGRYRGSPNDFTGYDGVYQASREWLTRGIHDYLAPQIYWEIDHETAPFDDLAREWVEEVNGLPVFPGMAVYKEAVQAEIDAQIDTARAVGATGHVFFRFDHMREAAGRIATRYAYAALPAPMTHRFEAVTPAVPRPVAIRSEGSTVVVEWEGVDDAPTDPVRAYTIFRRIGAPPDASLAEDLYAVASASTRAFSETFDEPPVQPVYYRVAAVSRLGQLSDGSDAVSTEATALAVVSDPPPARDPLVAIYPNPVRRTVTVAFDLGRPADVTLAVYDVLGRLVLVLDDEFYGAGGHELSTEVTLAPGVYYCELRSDAFRVGTSFTVVP